MAKHNRLVIVSGIPGSGKSTYCRKFKKAYEEKGMTVKIVSSDAIRYTLTGRYDDFSMDKVMWATFREMISEYSKLDNTIVILDATFLSNKKRYNFALQYKKMYKQIYLVVMDTDWDRCVKQNKLRVKGKWVPEKEMKEMLDKFEPIDRLTCFSYFYSVEYHNPDKPIRVETL